MAQNNTINNRIEIKTPYSTLLATNTEVVITISCSHWTQKQLGRLLSILLLLVNNWSWVAKPSESSNSMVGEGQPRWKVMSIDVLGALLFALMIPKSHRLRKLFDAIDWKSIDEQCADAYENAGKGAPAYPPQVLFRILVLTLRQAQGKCS